MKHHIAKRGGFTLLELLVIISIVAVLLVLTAAAAFRLMGASTTGATKTLLARLETRLRTQMTERADRAREAVIPDGIKDLAGRDKSLANFNHDLARVILTKLRLKSEFPMTFREALDPANGTGLIRPVGTYVRHLNERGITLATLGAVGPHESAACLYMALKFGPGGIGDEELGVSGSVKQVNGIECYVDAWGVPLLYCRTPVGNATTGASIIYPGGAPFGFEDTFDPKNALLTPAWYSSGNYTTFRNLLHPVLAAKPNGKKVTLTPVIISAGPDKAPGVNLTTFEVSGAGSDDNILTERFR